MSLLGGGGGDTLFWRIYYWGGGGDTFIWNYYCGDSGDTLK